jgi:hypothetical protein
MSEWEVEKPEKLTLRKRYSDDVEAIITQQLDLEGCFSVIIKRDIFTSHDNHYELVLLEINAYDIDGLDNAKSASDSLYIKYFTGKFWESITKKVEK